MKQDLKLSLSLWCDQGILFALCALIFFLPVSIALVDTFAGIAIFFYLLKRIILHKNIFPDTSVLNRPIEILIMVILFSALQGEYVGVSLYAFFGKFLKGVFLCFSFLEAFYGKKRIHWFLYAFLAGAFLSGLNGLAQFYSGTDFLRGHVLIGVRLNSSFSQPNTFGSFLLIPLAVTCHLLFSISGKGKPQSVQLILALLTVVLLVCLCWTYSRASWVGYLASLFLMAIIDKKKILYALFFLMILIYFFIPNLNTMRHLNLFRDTIEVSRVHKGLSSFLEEGGSGRYAFWKNAVFIIKKYPVWGSGLNTYTLDLRKFSLPQWYAHNCYLQMTAETGLIGLTAFLWLLFILFRAAFYTLQSASQEMWSKSLLQGLVAGLGGLLVNSFLDNSLFTVQIGVLFWIMAGFTVAVIRIQQGTFKTI